MKSLVAALLLAAGLLAALPAQAQVPVSDLSLTATPPAAPIPYAGSADVAVQVKVGCELVTQGYVQGGASAPIEVKAVNPPAWLTVASAPIATSPADCVGTTDGYHTYAGTATFTVTPDAPGVVDHVVNLTAALGTAASTAVPVTFNVTYHVSYSLKPDVAFPLKVTKSKTTFNLTVTQSSNARSMVMMEDVKSSSGLISGLASQVYECDAGKPVTKVFKVTYTAPDGAWNKSMVSFTAYGHFLLLDSRAGKFDAGTHEAWEFDNGGVQPAATGAAKKSPEPVGPLIALGLVGLAAVLRRKA